MTSPTGTHTYPYLRFPVTYSAARNQWPSKGRGKVDKLSSSFRENHVIDRGIEFTYRGTCGSFAENIRYFHHRTPCQKRCFWSRNTISIVMGVVYMNIETLIVINKCLPRTKILLLRHLKTMFATKKWKTVKIRPQRMASWYFLKASCKVTYIFLIGWLLTLHCLKTQCF